MDAIFDFNFFRIFSEFDLFWKRRVESYFEF